MAIKKFRLQVCCILFREWNDVKMLSQTKLRKQNLHSMAEIFASSFERKNRKNQDVCQQPHVI